MNILCTALALLSSVQPADTPALTGLDPVALCQGAKRKGDPRFQAKHGTYTYHFTSDESRRLFQASPERYAIAFDGACAKMGPTSGRGSQDRFAVHEGRIYLFASDACYQWFVLNPERYVDKPDVRPTTNRQSEALGRQWIEKLAGSLGARSAIERFSAIRERLDITQGTGANEYKYSVTRWTDPTGRFIELQDYGTSKYWTVADSKRAIQIGPKEEREVLSRDTREFLLRKASRHPLVLVRAVLDNRAKAWSLGPSQDREGAFHRVMVHLNGANTVLSIDERTGALRSWAFRGRGTTGIADVVKIPLNWVTIDGIQVAKEIRTIVDGTPVPASAGTVVAITPDPEGLAAALKLL